MQNAKITMKMITKWIQEHYHRKAWDIAFNHVIKQGKRSVDASGNSCMYRGAGGLQCAFGPFINYYLPKMEGRDAVSLIRFNGGCIEEWVVKYCDIEYMRQIQICHDTADINFTENFIENFARRMETIRSGRKVAREIIYEI